jgi:hypothetical protein
MGNNHLKGVNGDVNERCGHGFKPMAVNSLNVFLSAWHGGGCPGSILPPSHREIVKGTVASVKSLAKSAVAKYSSIIRKRTSVGINFVA